MHNTNDIFEISLQLAKYTIHILETDDFFWCRFFLHVLVLCKLGYSELLVPSFFLLFVAPSITGSLFCLSFFCGRHTLSVLRSSVFLVLLIGTIYRLSTQTRVKWN